MHHRIASVHLFEDTVISMPAPASMIMFSISNHERIMDSFCFTNPLPLSETC